MSSWIDDLERQIDVDSAELRWKTPGAMAAELDPATGLTTAALELVDEFLVRISTKPDGRGILVMPPQEGKSQRTSRRFPLWTLKRDPECRIGLVSYEHSVARRWGRTVRDDIRQHPEVGLVVRRDLSGQSEWQLAGHRGGMFSTGIGGALTGRPLDLLIIDDPIKDAKQADSEEWRARCWDWWLNVGSTRLSPGSSVILILTRWHDDDLAGRLLAAEDGEDWEVLRIAAEAEDPKSLPESDRDYGKPDPLGRTPGTFLESVQGRTVEQWQAIRRRSGSRTWNALYQGRPSAAAGDVFDRSWWGEYDVPPWTVRQDGAHLIVGQYDELMISGDFTFKDTSSSDFVALHVYLRRGAEVLLVDRINERLDFVGTLRAFVQLAGKWPQATLKLIEDKANGPAVIAMLRRKIPGIVPEEPDGSKYARAVAVSPLVEAGNILLPNPRIEGCAWVSAFVEQLAAFPRGAHDDDVDAFSQAAKRLLLIPLLAGGEVYGLEDLDADLAGYSISPY